MNAIHNERVKLAASALSNMGIAIIITGLVTAFAAVLHGAAPLNATLLPTALALALIGFALLAVARLLLGRLEDV